MFDFSLEALNRMAETSNFALLIRDSFLSRILYRRNRELSTLMQYLENRNFLNENDQVLSKATKEEIIEAAYGLFIRIFPDQVLQPSQNQVSK